MKLLYMKIRCLYMRLSGTSQMCAELLYRFALGYIRQIDTVLLCRRDYISTYSRACIIQSIDTARVDVSDAKRDSIVAIIILMALFVSFPASCNVLASIFLRIFMLTVAASFASV